MTEQQIPETTAAAEIIAANAEAAAEVRATHAQPSAYPPAGTYLGRIEAGHYAPMHKSRDQMAWELLVALAGNSAAPEMHGPDSMIAWAYDLADLFLARASANSAAVQEAPRRGPGVGHARGND